MNAIVKPNQLAVDRGSLSAGSAAAAPKVPWALSFGAVILGLIGFGVYRWYQETHSFSVGLDYFENDFQVYWMRLFYAQIIIIPILGMIGVPLMWFTRDKDINNLSPQIELRRYYTMLSLVAVGSVLAVATLGIYVEADAAWHQVTVRDTDFTPTHIGLFYFAIPLALVGLMIGFVWVHTRLPDFSHRISIPMAMMVAGPILIMPNLGFNEWGHTFFYMEELFAAPIHWGFVVLGWSLFAIGGFVTQCIDRMRGLLALPEARADQGLIR